MDIVEWSLSLSLSFRLSLGNIFVLPIEINDNNKARGDCGCDDYLHPQNRNGIITVGGIRSRRLFSRISNRSKFKYAFSFGITRYIFVFFIIIIIIHIINTYCTLYITTVKYVMSNEFVYILRYIKHMFFDFPIQFIYV